MIFYRTLKICDHDSGFTIKKLDAFLYFFIKVSCVCFFFVFCLQTLKQMVNFLKLIHREFKVFAFQAISIFNQLQHLQASPFSEKNIISLGVFFIEHFYDGRPQKQRQFVLKILLDCQRNYLLKLINSPVKAFILFFRRRHLR